MKPQASLRRAAGYLWLTGALLGLVHCSAERPPAKVPGASREERLARYHESAKNIAQELGELGFPVKISEVTLALGERKQDISNFFDAAYKTSDSSYEALATLLRALGIAKEATASDLRVSAVRSELLSVEAYYDPVGQAMVLRSSSFDQFSDFDLVIAHELAHVYQDQAQGGLEAFQNINAYSLDRSRSAQAIVEGQAMLMAHAVLLKRRGRKLSDLDLSLNEASTGQLLTGEGAGAMYDAGQKFLLAQYKSGGWPAVHAAYRSPPISTEQLLHPEKYGVDTPCIVTLPEWPNAQDKVHWLSSEVLGELAIKSALAIALTSDEDTTLEGRNMAESGSMGWDGDRFDSYELESGQRAALWRSVWDTEPAAREFAGILRRFISKQKLEPRHYSVSQRDIVVDFAFSEDEALVPVLARALSEHPRHFRAQAQDAASTAAAKAAAAERHARRPRSDGKYWVHPPSAVRVPIPEGWKVSVRGGLPQLLGEEREDEGTPGISAFRVQDVWDGDLRAVLHKLENAYFANPTRFGQVESDVRRVAGSEVGVITLRIGNKVSGAMVRLWLIPRPGHYLLLAAGFPEDLWKESASLLATLERGLVIEPAEL